MARWGNCNFNQLKNFQKSIEKLEKGDSAKLCEDLAKEIALRLLRKVKKRTPVGVYSSLVSFTTKDGKKVTFNRRSTRVGGNLRRRWNVSNVKKVGNMYEVEVINNVEYASYVEFGHRTRNHNGWVKGKFMLTISEKEIEQATPKLLEKKVQEYLERCFNVK